MTISLAIVVCVAIVVIACTIGVALSLVSVGQHAPRAQQSPEEPVAPPGSHWREQFGEIVVTANGSFLTVHRVVRPGTGAGMGQVALYFIDVRADGDALRFDYLPGGAHSARRIVRVPAELAGELAARLRRRLALPRERTLREVSRDELERAPAAFHGEVIRLRSTWTRGLESSAIATQVWLQPPEGADDGASQGTRDVEVVALFLWHGQARGLGHLGLWSGELVAFELRDAAVRPGAT